MFLQNLSKNELPNDQNSSLVSDEIQRTFWTNFVQNENYKIVIMLYAWRDWTRYFWCCNLKREPLFKIRLK